MSSRSSESWAKRLVCSASGVVAPLDRPAFLSPVGKPWLVEYDLEGRNGKAWAQELPGRRWTLWRYRELLPVANPDGAVDLGEGGTPLIALQRLAPAGTRVFVKDESGNPTGSFKARGLSLAVNRARELGAPGVELPSAGNAALALAAYAAAAGLPARIAIPDDTPAVIAERCRLYGAEVITGGRDLTESAQRLAEAGQDDGGEYWNLSTLKEPYRAEGKKTMGLELAEQMGWDLPEWIVYPTGGGTGIVGMHKAFDELERLGLVGERRPRFVSVQMAGCAPIVRAFEAGEEAAEPWRDPETQVYGLRVPKAVGDFLILRALRETGGRALAVAEEHLAPKARRVAAEEGLLIGPEGAACFLALDRLVAEGALAEGDRVVIFQTGHPANYDWRPGTD
jgi:threonine synthase